MKNQDDEIADTKKKIADASGRLNEINKDFDAAGHYIGSGTSADAAREAKERAALNLQLKQDQETLAGQRAAQGATQKEKDAAAAEQAKSDKDRTDQLGLETGEAGLRAQGRDHAADLLALRAKIADQIKNAPDTQAGRRAAILLGQSELAEFQHADQKPFHGSMQEWSNDFQMKILEHAGTANDEKLLSAQLAAANAMNEVAKDIKNINLVGVLKDQ